MKLCCFFFGHKLVDIGIRSYNSGKDIIAVHMICEKCAGITKINIPKPEDQKGPELCHTCGDKI